MKKMKIAFWVLVFAALALIIYQNLAFFRAPLSLKLNLGFKTYATPEFQIWVFFIGLFLLGILLTYLFCLPAKFRAGKNIRALNATIASQRKELDLLKKDILAMRSPQPDEPIQEKPAPGGTDEAEPPA